MRKQSFRALAMITGLDYSQDPILIADTSSPNLSCVRFDKGLVKKDLGRANFANQTSQYPVTQDTNGVKATSEYSNDYLPYFTTDPTLDLLGGGTNQQWYCANGSNSNQRFHIAFDKPRIIDRIYYENSHSSGNSTIQGAKTFTLWGSNDANAFADLGYANDANWTQVNGCNSNQFFQHANTDTADPKYITIANVNTPYKYYAFKFANNWGGTSMGVRRIELQQSAKLAGYVMHIDTFPTYLGGFYYLFFTVDWVYSLQSDGSFDIINSNHQFTGALSDNYYTTIALDANGTLQFLIANGKDPIKKWDSANFANLRGLDDAIGSILLNDGGANYTVGDVLTIQQANSGNDATASVDTVDANGVVTGVSLVNRGSGYSANSNLATTVAPANGTNCTLDVLSVGGVMTGKYIIPFKDRLIMARTVEDGYSNPTRIRWSTLGDIEDWLGTGAGFIDAAETADWCIGLCLYKNRLVVFKERSIWELKYVGGTQIFQLSRLIDGVGAATGKGIIPLGDNIVFFGWDSIYTYDFYNLTSISDNIYALMYPTETRILNLSKIFRTRSAYIEEINELWIVFPTVGETPDTLFKYNFDSKSWTKRTLEVTAFGYYSIDVGETWADQTLTWENYVGYWVTRLLSSGAPTTLMGDSSGYIYEDDRLTTTDDTFVFETKDWIMPTKENILTRDTWALAMRIVEIRLSTKGGPYYVSYSLDSGVTWSSPKEFPVSTEFVENILYLNTVAQRMRVKVTSTAASFEIEWIEPWVMGRAQSKSLIHTVS